MRFLLLLALLASCSAIPITIPQSDDALGSTFADALNPDGPPDTGWHASLDGLSGPPPDAALDETDAGLDATADAEADATTDAEADAGLDATADAEADATLDDATLDDATPDAEAGS